MSAALIRPLGAKAVSLKNLCFSGVEGGWSEKAALSLRQVRRQPETRENVQRVVDTLLVACV